VAFRLISGQQARCGIEPAHPPLLLSYTYLALSGHWWVRLHGPGLVACCPLITGKSPAPGLRGAGVRGTYAAARPSVGASEGAEVWRLAMMSSSDVAAIAWLRFTVSRAASMISGVRSARTFALARRSFAS
jgi:hypothetical protein